jgi:hypothetical protein
MADKSKKDKADAQFKKVQRAEDAAKAMSAYESDAAKVRAKTERLRALRLARDAAIPAKEAPGPKKKPAKPRKGKSSSTLSEWLDGQNDQGRRR